ncbi:efflux RND transporter periplasmic adaptor subunit [Malikia spinosa]|nr:efflux RND transporter periplasmic adaptor subunit [Malikia spinosa]
MKCLHRMSLVALAALSIVGTASAAESVAEGGALATVELRSAAGQSNETSLDGVVEAVRQTRLSTQVAGAIVALQVKAGDRVKAGQELLRIDASAAQQGVAASASQVEAAQAQLKVAASELARQKQLHQKQYISQAALERSQAQWEAAQAQVNALQAQTRVAQAQSGFFLLKAPYAGVVSEVAVTLGDMALPGRPLLTLHDPSALRVTAAVPQALLGSLSSKLDQVRYEINGLAGSAARLQPASVELLPTIDAASHTAQIRLALPPAGAVGGAGATAVVGPASTAVMPGLFARVWLPAGASAKTGPQRLFLPTSAILRRAELTGAYVIDAQGKPRLRQVRLGRVSGDQVEVLTGLRPGDKVAADPQAAAAVAR